MDKKILNDNNFITKIEWPINKKKIKLGISKNQFIISMLRNKFIENDEWQNKSINEKIMI